MSQNQSDSEPSESDEEEITWFSTRQPKPLVEAAGIENKTQWVNRHLQQEVRGEEIVEAETKNEVAREQSDNTLEAIESVRSDLLKRGESSGAVSIEQVEDALTELMQEREQAVETSNKERLQQAQSRVADRESDPESVAVGAEKTPVEAAEALVDDTGTVPDAYLKEGPENVAVQKHAEECGMDPVEFYEFVLSELDEALLEIEGFGTWYDRSESATEHAGGSGVATDGGERR